MKLILFTPAIKSSAIGRTASLVARSLIAGGHEVNVVRTEHESLLNEPTHSFGAEPIPWDDSRRVAALAKTAEVSTYQIGDNYLFHQGCLEWLPRLPGVICLHDFFVGNLFRGWAQDRRQEAMTVLRSWYGGVTADDFFRYSSMEAFISGTRDTAPMTEWVCSMAQSVITHSGWGIERVLKSCSGPVHVVPLAYDVLKYIAGEDTGSRHNDGKFRILTVGHVNTNKRASSVIKAVGKSRLLRKKSIYRLVGNIQPDVSNELSGLANEHGVHLVISGEVDDKALAQAVAQADVISCLRWPSLEAASASAIEAMLCGKATIVTDTGFYREIPDSCSIKIDPENEISGIKIALESLYKNSDRRYGLGKRAQEWAKSTFTADNYAQRLLEIGLASSKAGVRIDAVRFFVELMNQWGSGSHLLSREHLIDPLRVFSSE